tara:strand:- start:286 stop:474 length:189 start_codon:yes stop_codon:yes gene_type:complete
MSMKQITITKSQFLKGDYSMESYNQKANPNATNSELEAKIVVKNDKEKDEEKEQYDKIPKRY